MNQKLEYVIYMFLQLLANVPIIDTLISDTDIIIVMNTFSLEFRNIEACEFCFSIFQNIQL